jgi:hypothetical protein
MTAKSKREFITPHAFERFRERFPGLDAADSLSRAVPVSWRKVRKATARYLGMMPSRVHMKLAEYREDPATGAVWVLGSRLGKGRRFVALTVLPPLEID